MNKSILTLTFALVCASSVLVADCSKANMSPTATNSTPPPNSQPNTVTIGNMAFGPVSVTVPAGTSVTWQNNDGVTHTSTSDTGVWDTGAISSGGSKTVVFNTPGTFPYHCSIHAMMTGTITVK